MKKITIIFILALTFPSLGLSFVGTTFWNQAEQAQVSPYQNFGIGVSFSCSLFSGAVKCRGRNANGQLGNNTLVDSTTAVTVIGFSSGATYVGAGNTHACALVNGGIKCWGNNSNGQLGVGASPLRSMTAIDVTGYTSGVSAIASSVLGECAIVSGAVKCWGSNSNGELGNGTTTDSNTPVSVSGLTGAASISGGWGHYCVITTTNTIKCWGAGGTGQLGNGATANATTYVIATGISGATQVACGTSHTCALISGGVKCWGQGIYGQLGNGASVNSLTPVSVTGLTSGVQSIATGGDSNYTCALTTAGEVRCWGNNTGGLGNGSTGTTNVPVQVIASGATVLTVGYYSACAIVNNVPKCWGVNTNGQLGDGTTTSATTPVTMN